MAGEKWYFDFKVWLDKARGLRAVRAPSGYKVATPTVCDYRVEITTGPNNDSKLESGTFSVSIMGSKGATGAVGLLEQARGPPGHMPI